MEAIELFNQFRPMVEGFVWKAYKHHRFLEKEELQSEAYLIFCETVKTYDPQKASFSTYLYRGLKDRLGNYCRIQYKRQHILIDTGWESDGKINNNGKSCSMAMRVYDKDCYCYNKRPVLYGIDWPEKSFNKFIETMEVIDSKTVLSNDAKTILDYIISRKWEIPGVYTKKPSYHSILNWYHYMYKWPKSRVENAWNELGTWWNKEAV